MNAILIVTAMLALGQADVAAAPQPATQLYVKTVPPGAAVAFDGKSLGRSDGLFEVAPGSHKVVLHAEGFVSEERAVDVREGEITRVEVAFQKKAEQQVVLSYVGDASDGQQSFADSGHAVAFQRPADMKSIVAVKLLAGRYGMPKAPDEDFHIYLLDEHQKVLEQIAVPYRKIARAKLQWHTLKFPAIAVPEKFFVAMWFNAEATKGVFLGKQNVAQSHSYVGLPDKGFEKVDQKYDWMIRAVVASEAGAKPTHPKVVTYEEESTAADAENSEAQHLDGAAKRPQRTWSDSTGTFSLEAEFDGVEQGKVTLKKADGKTVAVPLERLSKDDQEFVAQQAGAKPEAAKAAGREVRELSHDDGKKAGMLSAAGSAHAVKFSVDGDSWYVTSVSLHGSRYGEPRPPKEDFTVWICDAQFQPIATFQFPYSSFARGASAWKSFRVRPTQVPREFIVCFGFNPHQTKGVVVSHDGQASPNSMMGIPGEGPPGAFFKGNWMIRCKVEKRAEGETAVNPPKAEQPSP